MSALSRLSQLEKYVFGVIVVLFAYVLFTCGLVVGEAAKEKDIYDSTKTKASFIAFGMPIMCVDLDEIKNLK